MRMTPKRLAVLVDESARSVGNILLPQSAIKEAASGKVVSRGDDVPVEIGDRVAFKLHPTTRRTVDGEEVIFMTVDEVLAVIGDGVASRPERAMPRIYQ